jgi:hypothetical protein
MNMNPKQHITQEQSPSNRISNPNQSNTKTFCIKSKTEIGRRNAPHRYVKEAIYKPRSSDRSGKARDVLKRVINDPCQITNQLTNPDDKISLVKIKSLPLSTGHQKNPYLRLQLLLEQEEEGLCPLYVSPFPFALK